MVMGFSTSYPSETIVLDPQNRSECSLSPQEYLSDYTTGIEQGLPPLFSSSRLGIIPKSLKTKLALSLLIYGL